MKCNGDMITLVIIYNIIISFVSRLQLQTLEATISQQSWRPITYANEKLLQLFLTCRLCQYSRLFEL